MKRETTSPERGHLTGIILAGGAGTRMGSVDKGLLSLQGRPLIEHVIANLRPQVDDILIVANRNQSTYGEYGFDVLNDPVPDFAGPLIGMLAGLRACPSARALFVPVDAPRLPLNLAATLSQGTRQVAVAADARGLQPLCCRMDASLLPALETAVEAGERSPRQWLANLNPNVVRFEDEGLIWSVNTPEEFSALQEHPGLAA